MRVDLEKRDQNSRLCNSSWHHHQALFLTEQLQISGMLTRGTHYTINSGGPLGFGGLRDKALRTSVADDHTCMCIASKYMYDIYKVNTILAKVLVLMSNTCP